MSPTDTFIDPGFVDTGFVIDIITPARNQHITRFSECRRGRLPLDWIEIFATQSSGRINTTGSQSRVEGAACDLHHRNALRLQGEAVGSGGRTGVVWTIPALDTGANDVELSGRFKFLSSYTANREVFIARVSGGVGTENFYGLAFDVVGKTVSITKVINGTQTILGTSPATHTFVVGGFYIFRFRVEGIGLQIKVWSDGTTEPAFWDVTGIFDSTLTSGYVGAICQSPNEIIEIDYFAVGTNGEPAPAESTLPEPFDTYIRRDDDELELTVNFEFYNPSANGVGIGAVQNYWVSSHGRVTGPTDYPPNTVMYANLLDAGAVTRGLSADLALSAASGVSIDAIKLNNLPLTPNTPGPFGAWGGYSFTGRPIEIRLGKRWAVKPTSNADGLLSTHRSFEIITCAIPTADPDISPDVATVTVGSIDTLLARKLNAYTNVGIPMGVKSLTSSGWLSIPSSTSYNLTSFNIYLRLYVPLAGVPGSTFCTPSRRRIDSTHNQWNLELHSASHATVPNHLQLIVNDPTGAVLISTTPALLANLGRFIPIIISINGGIGWYMYVDGVKVGSGVIVGSPTPGTAGIVEILQDTSIGCVVCDHRIEQWADETTALARFASRREPDTLTISMHRCDDGSGNTVTDYATLANHGTLQGANVTDRIWSPTYLGSAGLVGSPMPLSGGAVYHLPTQSIDPVNTGYRYSDRAKSTGATVQVRAKGVVLTPVTNYTEPAEGPGTVDIVGAVSEPVTVQLLDTTTPGDPHMHIAQLIRDELINRQSLDASKCDQESFDSLRKLLPMRGGFYFQEPPVISDFLSNLLGPMGGYYDVDRSARLVTGCLTPTVNPGPYGQDSLLEFMGYPNKGVTFGPSTVYDLKQQVTFSLTAIFKTSALIIDPSTSSSFTYFPAGMTLIDRTNGATGYYLGIDGRDGNIIFGEPGVTVGGLHYTKLVFNLLPDTWYLVQARDLNGGRSISIWGMSGASNGVSAIVLDTVSGTMAAPTTGVPLKIGHGAQGSFVGSITQVIGASGAHGVAYGSTAAGNGPGGTPPVRPTLYMADLGGSSGVMDQYWIDLRGGVGDYALDAATGALGRIEGCRWCPRVSCDFTLSGAPILAHVRHPRPAWRIDSQYNTNYQTLIGTDVDALVSAADRAALAQAFVSDPIKNQSTLNNYLDSIEPDLTTPLVNTADGEFIRRLIASRLGTDRRYANIANWYREMLKVGLGDEIYVKSSTYPEFASGRAMRAFGLVQRIALLNSDCDIWG